MDLFHNKSLGKAPVFRYVDHATAIYRTVENKRPVTNFTKQDDHKMWMKISDFKKDLINKTFPEPYRLGRGHRSDFEDHISCMMHGLGSCFHRDLTIILPWLYRFRLNYTRSEENYRETPILFYLDDLILEALTKDKTDRVRRKSNQDRLEKEAIEEWIKNGEEVPDLDELEDIVEEDEEEEEHMDPYEVAAMFS